MPRVRVPTAILDSRGAFVKHPERRAARKNEPVPTQDLGGPPKHLRAAEKKVWTELSAKLAPGVAANSDETAFEVLVCLLVRFRSSQRKKDDPVVGEVAQMNKLFAQFAMTPADRTRVNVKAGTKKPNDSLEEFLDDDQSAVN